MKRSSAVFLWSLIITMFVVADSSLSDVWQKFDTMEWKAGDRIACILKNFFAGSIAHFKHWMLAVDEESIIHIVSNKKNDDARIRLQNRGKVSTKIFVRDKCINFGPGTFGIHAVERAMSWERGKSYLYNLYTCNCHHWVNLWVDGKTGSFDKACPRIREIESK